MRVNKGRGEGNSSGILKHKETKGAYKGDLGSMKIYSTDILDWLI